MEEKRNESTSLRPEGDRLLDAKLVRIDLSDLNEQIRREILPFCLPWLLPEVQRSKFHQAYK